MTPAEINALPPVTIDGTPYTLCHIGGPTTKRTKKTIFVESAPSRSWTLGQPIPDKVLSRWLREADTLVAASKAFIVRLQREQVFVFGPWKAEYAAMIDQLIAGSRSGGFNPHAYGFQQFADAVAALKGAELRRMQARVKQLEGEIAETTTRLTAMVRDLRGAQQLAAIQAQPVDVTGILQRAAAVEGVVGLRLDGTTLVLSTVPITIRNRGKHYDIGRFEVFINVSTAELRFKNLTRTVDGNHHPHIFSYGGACLGEITAVVPRLLGDFMLPELVTVLVRYLRSVNHRDVAGRHIVDWPLVAEEPVPAAA